MEQKMESQMRIKAYLNIQELFSIHPNGKQQERSLFFLLRILSFSALQIHGSDNVIQQKLLLNVKALLEWNSLNGG